MYLKEEIKTIVEKLGDVSRGDVMRGLKNRVSPTHVSRILKKLCDEGVIVRIGGGRYTRYMSKKGLSKKTQSIHKRIKNEHINEDNVFSELQNNFSVLETLPRNTQKIFEYSFLEMVNNAIEHSRSKYIEYRVAVDPHETMFVVSDFGIGVFRNVMQKRKLHSEFEAMQDILKGKTTTAPEAHSGEGIFFTSKLADLFVLESFGYKLTVDNIIQDVFFEKTDSRKKGSAATFRIQHTSRTEMEEVFREYQTDASGFSFDKTKVKVRLYMLGMDYVSRSQARRLLSGLEKFRTIVLDFHKVQAVGQAFADEVFRVFKKKHPESSVEATNMNEAVSFMVRRAIETKR